jgi:hypothetical protein
MYLYPAAAAALMQSQSRVQAAGLLRTMLTMASDATHQYVHQLVPALCK